MELEDKYMRNKRANSIQQQQQQQQPQPQQQQQQQRQRQQQQRQLQEQQQQGPTRVSPDMAYGLPMSKDGDEDIR